MAENGKQEPELDLSSHAGLIPDFFYELIARIAPGSIAIALSIYWANGDFETVYSSGVLSVFLLVPAWIIGVTLDLSVFSVLRPIFYRHKKPKDLEAPKDVKGLKGWAKVVHYFIPYEDPTLEVIEKWPSLERVLFTKKKAEVIFLRIMCTLCAVIALVCMVMNPFLPLGGWLRHHFPSPSSWDYATWLGNKLPILQLHSRPFFWLCLILTVVFYWCWREESYALGLGIELWRKKANSPEKEKVSDRLFANPLFELKVYGSEAAHTVPRGDAPPDEPR